MSQVNKLGFVDSKLGAPTGGQQTTRILFNTIPSTVAPSRQLSFFKSFQGLSNGQTNLSQNRLDSMESMIIKTIWLTEIDNDLGGLLTTFGGLRQQTLSIIVGNQTVVKNLPIQFNQGTNGQSFDRLHANAGSLSDVTNSPQATTEFNTVQPCEIRLLTDIVIPPQVSFEVRIESSVAYDQNTFVCALNGYGKIFSAGSSF